MSRKFESFSNAKRDEKSREVFGVPLKVASWVATNTEISVVPGKIPENQKQTSFLEKVNNRPAKKKKKLHVHMHQKKLLHVTRKRFFVHRQQKLKFGSGEVCCLPPP